MKLLWEWSYIAGPILLYCVGVVLKSLGSQSRGITWEHAFFSQEIALSNAGSVLSSFVLMFKAMTAGGKFDPDRFLVLITLAIFAVLILFLATLLHRAYDDHPGVVKRTKMCIFMLGFFANLVALGALSATLYHTSGHADM